VDKQQPLLHEMGNFVRERRRELGLTQEQLARRVGYVQERISVLERGRYGMPSLPALALLADALEVPLAEMLRRAGYQVEGDSGSRAEAARVGNKPEQFRRLLEENMRLAEELVSTQRRLQDACATMSEVDVLHERMRTSREQMRALVASLQH
jgi:transcriptional regulator with XRE-family HTH domain